MFTLKPVKNQVNIEGFHSIYYFEFGKGFSHTPEKHNFWEMVYVDKGKIIAITDGMGCNLEQGQVIFHEPNEVHAHVSNKEVANNMLVVSFSSQSPVMDFFRKKTFTLDKTACTLLSLFLQEAKNALGHIPNDYNNKIDLNFLEEKFGSTQLMGCHLAELLIKLYRNGTELGERFYPNSESRLIGKNSTVELITEYMKEHLYDTVTLPDLCDHFMLGKSQLSLIFKESTQKSPMQYYGELKIQEAKKLLREDNLSVSEITDLLCFTGIHNFSRSFKRITGFSPTEYKKSIL